MTWLWILGLTVWAVFQHRRIGALERKLDGLKGPERTTVNVVAPPVAAVGPAEPPLPPEIPFEPNPDPGMEARLKAADEMAPPPEPVWASPESIPAAAFERVESRGLANWLAENGLAWLGGGALALGGLLLATYAAQHGLFTPPMRIGAAVIVGALMLGASEWIRRGQARPGGQHILAAAVSAGAGGATLYGAFWAAHALYDLIPLPVAAALLAATCLGLLALSLIHVEALALVALAGAFAAPALTETVAWRPFTLEPYLTVLVVTGYAAAALKRWGKMATAALVGAVLWSLAAFQDGQPRQFGLLLLVALASAIAGVIWRRRRGLEQGAPLRLGDLFGAQPTGAAMVASLLSISPWINLNGPGFSVLDAGLLSGFLAAGVAAAIALRAAPGWAYAASAAAPALGLLLAAAEHVVTLRSGDPVVMFALVVVIAGAALAASLRSADGRAVLLGAGAIGAAALGSVAWRLLDSSGVSLPWLPPGLAAAVMFAGAVVLARRSPAPSEDNGLALWSAGAVELLFLTVYAAAPKDLAPVAQAAATLVLAFAAKRLGWKGLAQASVAGAFVVLASLLRPALVAEMLDGRLAPLLFAAVAVGATAILFAGGRVLSRAPKAAAEREALDTAALMAALWGAFLLLHRAAGAGGSGLGPLMETAIRTDLVLAAAVLLAYRAKAADGPIARWRIRLLLAAGVVHGIVGQGLWFNPWWGGGEQALGPPLLDTLAPAYLAPAAALAIIFRRGVAGPSFWTRATAASGFLFGLLWALLSLRHAFHPMALAAGAVGRAEAGCYALLAAVTAAGLLWLRSRPSVDQGRAAYLTAIAKPAAWVALGVLVLVFWFYSSPWWGALGKPLASVWAGLLLMGCYALGAVAATGLRRLSASGELRFRVVATCVAVGQLFVLLTLLIRWAFRGAAMRASIGAAGIETWAYSAIWAVFGLGVLIAGGQSRNRTLRWLGLLVLLGTLVKALLFDMARLDGVIRAASFLAIGALLVVGALAARRLNAGALFFRKTS